MNNQSKYPWGDCRRYYSYSRYHKSRFGQRIQKVAVDAGFTCPNRDGTLSTEGCYFCNNASFNPSYCTPKLSITQQIEEGILFHRKRYAGTTQYLVYFQPYSNTYAPLPTLQERYEEALSYPEVTGLVIGTRADCLTEEILDYIAELSHRYLIIVELGVESIYNHTLQFVNRCDTIEQNCRAMAGLAKRNIMTGAHFIFGLPNESKEEMLQYAHFIASQPIHSVKFHQLQIIKGTVMARIFEEQPTIFHRFTLEEYIDFLADFITLLPPTVVIERLAGEVPPRFLACQPWENLRNEQFIQRFEQRLESRDLFQGKYYVKR